MDPAIPGSSRGGVGGQGNRDDRGHQKRKPAKRARRNVTIQWEAPVKGSRRPDPPSLDKDDSDVSDHDSDTDDDRHNKSKLKRCYCGYCGEIVFMCRIKEHTIAKHKGLEPRWTFSKGKRGRYMVKIDEKQRNAIPGMESEVATGRREGISISVMRRRLCIGQARIRTDKESAEGGGAVDENDTDRSKTTPPNAIMNYHGPNGPVIPTKPTKNELRRQMKKQRSIKGVLNVAQSIVAIKTLHILECVPCKHAGGKRYRFHYNFSQGTKFQKNTKMPAQFVQLKNIICTHILKNDTHDKLVNHRPVVISDENATAGYAIGKTILKFAREGTAHKKLQSDLHLLWECGVKIGSLKHSNRSVREFLPALYKCQKEIVAEQLNQENPVTGPTYLSLSADKATFGGKSFHIIGLYALKEDDKDIFGLDPIFVEVLENKKGSGEVMAKEIVSAVLNMLGITRVELRKRYIGLAADGQVINCNIEKHITDELGGGCRFVTYSRDLGHLVELAAKASRQQWGDDISSIQIDWLQKTLCMTRKIANYYRASPKAWLRIRNLANTELASLDVNALTDEQVVDVFEAFLRPESFKQFSTTRWSAYTFEVLDALFKNYPGMFKDIQNVKDKKEKGSNKEKRDNASAILDTIASAAFVLTLCGLLDIYKLLSRISRNCQQSKVFIWTILRQNDALLRELSDLGPFFLTVGNTPATARPNSSYFYVAATRLSVVRQEQSPGTSTSNAAAKPYLSFKGCKIYNLWPYDKQWRARGTEEPLAEQINWKNLYNIDRLIITISEWLSLYANDLHDKLRSRFDENIPDVIKSTCAIFDINRITNQEISAVTEELTLLFSLSTEFGLYGDGNLQFPRFSREYEIFTLDVQLKVLEMSPLEGPESQKKKDAIYLEMLRARGPSLYPNVLRLLSVSAVRTCNESFIEGYASRIKYKYNKFRQSLSLDNLNSELFISINGPPTHKAERLVEKAWNEVFRGGPWHFLHKNQPSTDLKISKALDRAETQEECKFKTTPGIYTAIVNKK